MPWGSPPLLPGSEALTTTVRAPVQQLFLPEPRQPGPGQFALRLTRNEGNMCFTFHGSSRLLSPEAPAQELCSQIAQGCGQR